MTGDTSSSLADVCGELASTENSLASDEAALELLDRELLDAERAEAERAKMQRVAEVRDLATRVVKAARALDRCARKLGDAFVDHQSLCAALATYPDVHCRSAGSMLRGWDVASAINAANPQLAAHLDLRPVSAETLYSLESQAWATYVDDK